MARRLKMLICLSVIVATASSHALPTQETLVITKSDDGATASDAPTTVVTTEEPNAPIKLTEMKVRSEITMRYAHTAIVTHVNNPAKRSQEATFRVLLPETAFISGFVMILDGKPYKAYVKEKEEAKNIYNQAVSQGFGAAHVAAKARDSNIFTVSVNVEPNSKAMFNLTYEELLTRRNGVYNHAVNLHPGAMVPKLTVTVHIKETQKITVLRVPEVRTGNEIDATEEDAQNPNAVIERDAKNREATITFTPDLEEQKRLIQIYKEKSKEHYVDRYRFDDQKQTPQDGVLGQFVVQYDVDHSKGSDILVNDGYFVHFFAPTSLPPLSKHVVFVLDISGSMSGRKMDQLIEAMQTILSNLNKGDVFNIVHFESAVQVLDITSASESTQPVEQENHFYRDTSFDIPPLLPPVEATPENIAKAKLLVSKLTAGGGTNIGTALDVAIALIQRIAKGTNSTVDITTPKKEETQVNSNDTKVLETQESAKSEVAAAKETKNEDEDDEKEPIIIFLTDGEPTVGEGNPSRIIRVVAEKNYGKRKASIFSLAFGEDADRSFLRKLSLKNDGFMRHIYEASDASLQLRDFYRQISSPLLADVKFVYPPEQVKEGSLTKHKFRRFYAGSEAIVAGRVAENIDELEPHIYGICGVGLDDVGRKRYEITTKTPVSRDRDSYLPLERLWAYLTIQQLLDERHITDLSDDDEKSPAKKALALALKYEFVTPLTSLVVVKPNATSAVNAESVDKEAGSPFSPSLPGFAPLRPSAVQSGAFSGVPAYPGSSYPISLSGPPAPPPALSAAYEDFEEDYGNMLPQSISLQSAYDMMPTGMFQLQSNMMPTGMFQLQSKRMPTATFQLKSSIIPVSTTPASLSATLSPLAAYHLSSYQWAVSLLNNTSDCITLQTNGTQVTLKLTKDSAAPKAEGGDTECPSATDNSAGLCVYLTRCDAAQSITVDVYSRAYCVVSDGYAGVCCPKSEVDKTH
ncbi:unnamed protein product [Parnassius mnemosyne]|uniref:Inter-alpha-trypsin inhibitor heavy chain H4-like n=1 Tax=Parnassius mnemosyne TaxID=213953 RepID=A0AAV1M0J6_9NEOP